MLKNKIFIFFICFLCAFTFFICPVFATDTSVLPEKMVETMDEDMISDFRNSNYYALFYSNSSREYYLIFDTKGVLVYKEDGWFTFSCISGNGNYLIFSEDYSGIFTHISSGGLGTTDGLQISEDFYVLDANYVVKDRKTGEVFTLPPQVTGTLAPIYQRITLEEVLQEILAILPITLMTIVGLIGLRKALSLLFKVLRRS